MSVEPAATHSSPRERSPLLTFAVLFCAVLIVSSAAIVVRVAQAEGVSSLAIATWRLSIAAIILSALVAAKQSVRSKISAVPRRDLLLCAASGVFLAAHFASWISSLQFTSVASSTALVSTNPIWITLGAWLVLRERPGPWLLAGIACAMLGSGLIFFADAQLAARASGVSAGSSMLGNSLALVGSLTVCGYLLIGRRIRTTLSLLPYIFLVYGAAAITLLVSALLAGTTLTGFSALAWICLLGLALGPQLLGHTSFNWALKHLSASFVAIVILAEPVGSALLAWWLLDEHFAPLQLAGFIVLLSGIFLASQAERQDDRRPPSEELGISKPT